MNFLKKIILGLNVGFLYRKQQDNKDIETVSELDDLIPLSSAWKEKIIAKKQRIVVDKQLVNLRKGYLDPVFKSIIDTLNALPLQECTLLDAACASGYYSEVFESCLKRKIKYSGSDYSQSMIELAKTTYPKLSFYTEDLTELSFGSDEFETVLVSGVLEHIPNFEAAISESCRVASKYVILHRCLVSGTDSNIYTTGFLYNIKTPRIYYSSKVLEREFQKNKFRLVKSVKSAVYQGLISRVKLLVRKYILHHRSGVEYTLTFEKY